MAHFFQNLLDLGEQKPKPVNTSGRDLESMSTTELIALCSSSQQQLAAKEKQYDQLQSEAIALRKEHDAFKAKAEEWQTQMKVLRDNDRRLMEQLRSAAQHGESTDAVMTQALQETVTKLKEEIRAIGEDRAREARRRTDAELAMQRMEQENKREVATLKQNFDSLKSKMKEQQASAEQQEQQQLQQIRDLREKLSTAQITIERLERTADPALTSAAVATSSPTDANNAGGGDSGATAAAAATESPSTPNTTSSTDSSHLTEKIRQLQERLAASEQESQSSAAAASDAKRQLQKLEFDKRDSDNSAAQLRVEVESLQSRCAQLGAQLEEKDDAANKAKRHWQQQVQSLESAVEEERGLRVKASARLEAQLEQLKSDLVHAQQSSQDKEQMVTDAALRSKAAVAEGESQRQQLESALIALEGKLQEASSRRAAMESTLAETQAEIRRRNALIDDVRQEHDRTLQRLEEAEAQVLVQQKSNAAREREALARDRQLQSVEADLENERRDAQRLRLQNEEVSVALAAAQVKIAQLSKQQQQQQQQQNRNNSQNSFSSISPLAHVQSSTVEGSSESLEDSMRSPSPPNNNNNSNNGGAADADAERWASATREWLARLDHERRVAAEAVRVREDQSAKMRGLESRIDELTFKLSAAESASSIHTSGNNSSSAAGATSIAMPHHSATASSVLLSHGQAWHQQVMSTVQRHTGGWLANRRGLFLLALAFFAMILVFNFIAAGQTASASKDLETITTVKEKYFRCLEVVARCRQPEVPSAAKV